MDTQTEYTGLFKANATRQNPGALWVAQIGRAGQLFKLGTFDSDKVAAAVFDVASRRTDAWRIRKSRYNFPSIDEAHKHIPVSLLKVVEERIENVVKALRLIDPTAESRHRSEEKIASVVDEDEALTLLIQSIEAQVNALKARHKNALRVKSDKVNALQTEVDTFRTLAHERGAEIDRLKAEIEQITSASRVKIEIKPVTDKEEARLPEIVSEDPDDEDATSE